MVLHIFGGEVPGGNATTLWDSPVLPGLSGSSDSLSVPGNSYSHAMGQCCGLIGMESWMLRNGHVRFGGRAGETYQS